MKKKVIIIGAGGHGKVLANLISHCNDTVVGYLDDTKNIGSKVLDHIVLGKLDDIYNFNECEFIIGIGDNISRKSIADKYNVKWYTAIHPTAVLSKYVQICEGTVIMANTVINCSSKIGKHCIINTGCIVEHDNILNDFVHLSPNTTLCGSVEIGEMTHLGAGVTVRDHISICGNCIIGLGAAVIKKIDIPGIYIGIPAKKIN